MKVPPGTRTNRFCPGKRHDTAFSLSLSPRLLVSLTLVPFCSSPFTPSASRPNFACQIRPISLECIKFYSLQLSWAWRDHFPVSSFILLPLSFLRARPGHCCFSSSRLDDSSLFERADVSAGIDAFFSYEIPQTAFTRRIMFDGLKKRARLKLSTLGKSDTGNPF